MDTSASINQLCTVGEAAPSGATHHSLVLCSFMVIVAGPLYEGTSWKEWIIPSLCSLFPQVLQKPRALTFSHLNFISNLKTLKCLPLFSSAPKCNVQKVCAICHRVTRTPEMVAAHKAKSFFFFFPNTGTAEIRSVLSTSKLKRITHNFVMQME